MHRSLFFLPLLAAATGCATPPETASASRTGDSCFWASQVRGFSDAGRNRALVRVGARDMWELTVSPGCPGIDWAMRIGIRARGGERICTGRPAELLVPNASGRGMQRCLVTNVRRLSPEEAAAARGQTPDR
ncbi:MAG: hypothetical protein J7500_16365 [Sphingomonas sp.]|uniref:DUF6491 family protein n=1 Tax=Sphingomonas sp. TaxID=28214 RepID=UPI001B11160C|nr:DUF6491 family protein [Sphingomonas sp.]MBO9624284.1 hypothetical protein [Sphingomonas sp.]